MKARTVTFVAKSGTEKTTILEKVISEIKERGYHVGVIKHHTCRLDINTPDNARHHLTVAGADSMLVYSPEKLALIKQHQKLPSVDEMSVTYFADVDVFPPDGLKNRPSVDELLATYFADVDVFLTEGFEKSGLPKIEVHRRAHSSNLICRGGEYDPTLLAVASDSPLDLDVPVLDINNIVQVADFVERHIIHAAD